MNTTTKNRMEILRELSKDLFIHNGSDVLDESNADIEVTPKDHCELLTLFLEIAKKYFPKPNPTEVFLLRHICLKNAAKIQIMKRETLREHLQKQIDGGDIYDATGKISPETLWGMICLHVPELKGAYFLEEDYKGENDSNLKCAIVYVSAGLAMHSSNTRHLRR